MIRDSLDRTGKDASDFFAFVALDFELAITGGFGIGPKAPRQKVVIEIKAGEFFDNGTN